MTSVASVASVTSVTATFEAGRRGRDSGFFLKCDGVPAIAVAPEARPDEELVAALLTDEPWAWKEFQRRFDRLIQRCITKVTRRFSSLLGPDDVRDIYASLYLSLLANDRHKLRSFDPARGNRFSSWIGLLAIRRPRAGLRPAGPVRERGRGRARRHRGQPPGELQRQGPNLRDALLRGGARPQRDRVAPEHQREDGVLEEAQDPVASRIRPGRGQRTRRNRARRRERR